MSHTKPARRSAAQTQRAICTNTNLSIRNALLAAAVWVVGILLITPAAAVTVLWKAPNADVVMGLPFSAVEFENPLSGTETVAGYRVLDWRDADYAPLPVGGWYDDWIASDPLGIDGNPNEIWMRRSGHWISTTTARPGTVVSVHLTGDDNDGIAEVVVDNNIVARLDMYSSPLDRVAVIVRNLPDAVHTIRVNDRGQGGGPGGFEDDVAVNGAAVVEQIKWDQPPEPLAPGDLFYGWNEMSVHASPQIVADDWLCRSVDPVGDIHWWGSFLGWTGQELPPDSRPTRFQITIWTDVPAGVDQPFSHPGTVIWQSSCSDYAAAHVGYDFEPSRNIYESCFRFECTLPPHEWFFQQPDTIYWMSIAAVYDTTDPPYPWGFKTRPRDATSPAPDAAVLIVAPTAPVIGDHFIGGVPLSFSDGDWDLAFELTYTAAKWSQPPVVSPETCYNGWNEPSLYGQQWIVADDWVCVTDAPVTDVHWWGSFLGWTEPHLPDALLPQAFHIAIWTDVPSGPQPFSHPGVVLWEHYCTGFTAQFVGYDRDPRNPGTPPESCFLFQCRIPDGSEFTQSGDAAVIYWVSISAVYFLPPPPQTWGWKTRPHDPGSSPPDDAVRIFDPTAPVAGSVYRSGQPIWWPTPAESWDMAFTLTTRLARQLRPKWTQPLPVDAEAYDAPSDLWLTDGEAPGLKWEHDPDPDLPGLHAHDDATPAFWITQADDWQCTGGDVTALHWWGNIERLGSGLAGFHLSIHENMPGVPYGSPGFVLWSADVPIGDVEVIDTGVDNIEGSRIYLYIYTLPEPFPQIRDRIYWMDIRATSNFPGDPVLWRWQESARAFPPRLNPSMHQQDGMPWTPNAWPSETYSEFAFVIVSHEPAQLVNRVVADDFYSNGQKILAVRWWGSYLDDRYAPEAAVDTVHQLDGWVISFHHADINFNPHQPPDLLLDPPPTVIGLYYAPASAVHIRRLSISDCLNHLVYEYLIDLEQCCLLCSRADPRTGRHPAEPDGFRETRALRYWIDIQAVTGVEWKPPDCVKTPTGHLPSDLPGNNGHFWGWHTGFEPVDPWDPAPLPGPLDPAAVGSILVFAALPPYCWEYGRWQPLPWECPSFPPQINMAYQLLATLCPGDANGDGVVDNYDLQIILDAWAAHCGEPRYDPRADFNGDCVIDNYDLQVLLDNWARFCP